MAPPGNDAANPGVGNPVGDDPTTQPGGTATIEGTSGGPTGPEIAIAATLILLLIGVPVSVAGIPDPVARVFGRLRGVAAESPESDPTDSAGDVAARQIFRANMDDPDRVLQALTRDELLPPVPVVPPVAPVPPATPTESPAPVVTPAQLQRLQEGFEDSVRDRVIDGYYVRNPDLFTKFFYNTRDGLGIPTELDGHGEKGGQCEEFSNWGREWARPYVKDIFGDQAQISDIYVEKDPTNSLVPSLAKAYNAIPALTENHIATRVILPDGQSYVLDYWDGVGHGQPIIQTESQWVAEWKAKIGSVTPGGAVVHRSPTEDALRDLVNGSPGDSSKAFDQFRHQYRANPKETNDLISRWQRHPWTA